MQIEAVRPRVTVTERRRLTRLGRVTQTPHPSAPLRPQRHGPLHRRRGQPGQYRRLVLPHVWSADIAVTIPKSPPFEQARDPRLHRGQHLRHVQRGETTRGAKRQGTGTVPREDAVQHECVDVYVEIERPPEPLG